MTEDDVNALLLDPNVQGFARQVLLMLQKNFQKVQEQSEPQE